MLQQTLYTVGRAAIAAHTHVGVNLDIVRHAPLPDGPRIIAPDHPSTLDPAYITLLTREPMHILITGMCFDLPLLGRALRLAGQVPVVTGNGREAFDVALRLLREGRTVAVFPTGALSPLDGGPQRPRTGVARLALGTGAPIIPVGIALEPERIRYLQVSTPHESATSRMYLRGLYAVTVGEPLWWTGDVEDRERVRAISRRLMERIAGLSLESARRIEVRRFERQAHTARAGLRGLRWLPGAK
jgi:1-acyl-sn-glycerol-3-phosphate acyltransferase